MKKCTSLLRLSVVGVLLLLCENALADITVNVGYKVDYDYVYAYDGIGGLNADTDVSAAIMVTPEMLAPYVGARVKALRIGWADPEHQGQCTIFLRKTLYSTGEVLAEGSGTLVCKNDGKWNIVNFKEPYVITNEGLTLWAGYSTNIKKNTYAISTMYPHYQPGSCFLWRADMPTDENGNELWSDLNDMGSLSIQLVVEGSEDVLNNKVTLDWLRYQPIIVEGNTVKGYVKLSNRGGNAVKELTITCQQGEKSVENKVTLKNNLAPGASNKEYVSFKIPASGTSTFSITGVGGKANPLATVEEVNVLSIPANVASEYVRRPLVEFIESEGSHLVPSYYDEIFNPGFVPFGDRCTLVAQHMTDQFMTGMDEETRMMLDFAAGDSSALQCPAMMVDRMDPIDNPVADVGVPFFSILYPDFAGSYAYNPALKVPTCVGVGIDVQMTPNSREGVVTVKGNIAENVMGDEPLYLTLYLVEDRVESNSQDKPITYNDDDKDDGKDDGKGGEGVAPGYYVHDNVIRWRMTPMYGVKVGTGGAFSKSFDFELEDEWKFDDIRFVAVINRGMEGNDNMHMNVMNTAEVRLRDVADSIRLVEEEDGDGLWFDLMGRRVDHPAKGDVVVRYSNGKAVKVMAR